jgi:hypothetical protein
MSVSRRALLAIALLPLLSQPAFAQATTDAGLPPDAGVGTGSLSVQINTGEDEDTPPSGPRHARHRHHDGHDDRVNVGGSITVKEGETVDDAVAVGGALDVEGHVRGDAVAVGGPLHVFRGGHVDGDVVAIGGPLQVDDGAVVDGEHLSVGSMLGFGGLAGVAGAIGTLAILWTIVRTLVYVLGMIALGALFVAFIPERLDRMRHVLVARPLPALGAGVLAFLGIVPATLLLVITIVGILLIPLLWLGFGLLIALGLAVVAQLIGERLLRGTRYGGPVATLALGALILAVVHLVPILGLLAFIVAMIAGTGAVLLSRGGDPRAGSAVPPPPAAPQDDTTPVAGPQLGAGNPAP